MKRPIPFSSNPVWLCAAMLLLSALAGSPAQAARRHSSQGSGSSESGGVDANFFYQNLLNDGTWYNTTEYGDVWRPSVADQQPDWRPYTNGSWADTEQGYTWVSNESFGWATYHYGRWTDNIKGIGWVWVPGYDWAPAWVSFRTSDPRLLGAVGVEEDPAAGAPPPGPPAPREEPPGRAPADAPPPPPPRMAGEPVPEPFIGWAPLPPEAAWGPAGFATSVDIDYDIGPEDYCFVPVRYFGAPRLQEVIVVRGSNYDYVGRSINTTRIAYVRGGGRQVIRVDGPDQALVNRLSERPIPRLSLQRETNPRLASAAIGERRSNQVAGNRLIVAGPRITAPTASTRLQRPPAAKVPVIPRNARPTAPGVDAQTAQRVREHVAAQARGAAFSGESRERGQTRAAADRSERANFDGDRSPSSNARESSARGGRGRHGDSGARVARSGGSGGSRHVNGHGRGGGGGGGGGRGFRPAPRRAVYAPAPQQSSGGRKRGGDRQVAPSGPP